MKKASILSGLLLMIALPLMAEHVDPETARKAATTFLSNNGAKAAQLVDLSKAAGFDNLYIFNAEEGFVILSADDCAKPILGYSLTGKFVAEDMPENLKGWLQGYSDEIQYAIDNQAKASSEAAQMWSDLLEGKTNVAKATAVVEPLIQTQWDQGSPYNNLCPSGTVTGCVATAMAQVMNYWGYPSHGLGSHSYIPKTNSEYGEQFADFNSTNYDWDNMSDTYSSSNTPAQKAAVATLMYHCGVSIEMKYGPSSTGGSSASGADVPTALKTYFNYSPDVHLVKRSTANQTYTDSAWIALLKEELNLRRPIQYQGSSSNGTGGHSFVCDGYDSDDYFHFNWGWSGKCDAYYTTDNLNPGPNGIGSGTYGIYSYNQNVILGAHPSECTLASPTNLSFAQSNRDVTFSWTGETEAVSYNIYRNNAIIGNTSETSYVETAPYGQSVYYVCSVDSNGNTSLSSNTVTITVNYQVPIIHDLEATLSNDVLNLNWTAPEWCFPETESSILTYGDGSSGRFFGYGGITEMHWGHRYLPSDLKETSGKVIYRVSFFVREPGLYALKIYKGTTTLSNSYGTFEMPDSLQLQKQFSTAKIGWFFIDLDEPISIDNSQDLWILMHDPEQKNLPAEYCIFNEHDRGSYFTPSIIEGILQETGIAFLIRTYLTDGTYTYNLYDGDTKVNEVGPITTTSYTVENITDDIHQFTVKTNYYGGESEASNKVGITVGNAALSALDLDNNNKMTLTSGSVLTVGTLTNNDPDNLIIEDGAQLINESTGVKATVKQNITAYTSGADGWSFIASPVTETLVASEITGLITTDTYDLYYLDEGSEKWINYKDNDNHTNIDPGFDIQSKKGYLYANSANNTISFKGTLQQDGSVSLAKTNNGWNLIGNPFTCDAYASQSFYRIVNGALDANIKDNTTPIPPCTGILVKADSNGATFTFSKTAPETNTNNGNLKIALAQATTTRDGAENLDKAYVSFNEGSELGKFYLGLQNANIYIPQNGEEYTIAYSKQHGEMPLCFKANHDGEYTITVNAEDVKMDYLHLIDNIASKDVDLIATSSYTFSANADDPESRFRLMFSTSGFNPEKDDNFAFISDGTIFIFTDDVFSASLQVIDMTGRVVLRRDGACTVSTDGMKPGVYVLQIITENEIKTQKIIIK